MMWRTEAEAEHIDRSKIELDEASFAQSGKHAFGELQVIEPEAVGA